MDLTETLKSKNRVAWLDAAKLLGIFLVILGHIQIKNYGFFSPRDFIFVFHMPLFFFLSGLTQKNLSFKENLKDGVRKLLIPYVVFYFLTWSWWFVVACLRHPELYPDVFRDGIVKPFLGLFIADGYNTKISVMQNTPLWFLVGLFWCKMLFSLVQTKAENPQKANLVFSVFLLFLGFVLGYFGIPREVTVFKFGIETTIITITVPFSLGTLTLSYVWFFAGTQMKEKFFTNETKNFPKSKRFVLLLLFLLLTVAICFFNNKLDSTHNISINRWKYGNDVFLYLLGAVCGMIFVYELSVLISPLPKFFGFLGRNTITILAFHYLAREWIRIFLKYIFHYELVSTEENPFGIGTALFLAVISLLLCAVPSFIFEKWFPFVLGRKKREGKSVQA